MTKDNTGRSDLVHFRMDMDRRTLLKGIGAAGALAVAGLPPLAAQAATKLNFIGWEGYDSFLEADDFSKKSGAALQKSYISSTDEIVTKLRLNPAQVDLCTPYFTTDHFLAEDSLIEEIDLSKVPNFKNIHPTILKYCEGNMSKDGKWYAVPMTYGSNCMVYNADIIKTAPTSWTDMLKPEYKGKCAITADYQGNIFAWARVAGVKDPAHMTYDELKKTTDLLIDLKKNHLRTIAPSYGDLVTMLSSKEVIIAQGWEPVAEWVGKAATIKVAYPKEQAMGFIEGYAIGKGSPNIDAAHAFINNALSIKGQLAGATANSMPVVIADAIPQTPPDNQALYDYKGLDQYFTVKTNVVSMYPLDSDGVHATWDDYQEAWEKVFKA
ncbi:MAG: extracellular solute-binding protein [Parvibaculaceae bacterium]|nr:extracellular solute-binding protein [Parvibaculaceae bacterium]